MSYNHRNFHRTNYEDEEPINDNDFRGEQEPEEKIISGHSIEGNQDNFDGNYENDEFNEEGHSDGVFKNYDGEDEEFQNEIEEHNVIGNEGTNYYEENNTIDENGIEEYENVRPFHNENRNQINEEPIYIMTLELEKGKSEKVKIFANSNPSQLAYEFCKVNDLDFNALHFLTLEIEKLMNTFKLHKMDIDKNESEFPDHNNQIIEVDEENLQTDKNKPENDIENPISTGLINIENGDNESNSINDSEKGNANMAKPELFLYTNSNADEKGTIELKDNKKSDNFLIYSSIEDRDEEIYQNNSNLKFEPEKQERNKDRSNKFSDEGSFETDNKILIKEEEIKENNLNQDDYEEHEIISYHDTNSLNNLNKNQDKNDEIDFQNNKVSNYNEHIDNLIEVFDDENVEKSINAYDHSKVKLNIENIQNDNHNPSEKIKPKLFPYQFLTDSSNVNNGDNAYNNKTLFSGPQQANSYSNQISIANNLSAFQPVNNKITIFDRLFQDAEIKRRTKSRMLNFNQSANLKSTHLNSLSITHSQNGKSKHKNTVEGNYGEYLYNRGKLLNEEKMRVIAQKKSEMEQKLAENNTFKPSINKQNPILNYKENKIHEYNHQKEKVARNLKENTENNSNEFKQPVVRNYNILKNDNENNNNRRSFGVNKNKNEFTKKDMNNNITHNIINSSTPYISNSHAQNIIQNNQKSININRSSSHHNLFSNPSQLNKKLHKLDQIRNEISSQFSFQPNINKNYQFNLNFQERQELFKESVNQHKKERHEESKQLVDKNGNPLFKPRLISKSKNYKRNTHSVDGNHKDVFTQNYEYARRYDQNKKNLSHKYYQVEPKQIHNESDAIFNMVKEETFVKLFSDLDTDQDDLITSQCIGLKNIPSNILKIINPIVNELREQNETLTKEEFVKAMHHLYEVLNFEERQDLIFYYKYKKSHNKKLQRHSQPYNFKPTINKHSEKLALKNDQKLTQSLSVNNLIKKRKNENNNSFFKINPFINAGAYEDLQNYTFKNYRQNFSYNI